MDEEESETSFQKWARSKQGRLYVKSLDKRIDQVTKSLVLAGKDSSDGNVAGHARLYIELVAQVSALTAGVTDED